MSGPQVYEKNSVAQTWGPLGSTSSVELAVSAFPLPTVSNIEAQFATALALAGIAPGTVGSVAFKYMRFTDDPDLIVGTLMIADGPDFVAATNGISRVVLVRRSDGQIWDLTRLIEAMESTARGSFGAWAPASASPATW